MSMPPRSAPLTPLGYRALLAYPAFTFLWIGQVVSIFGDALYDVALLFYVFSTTHSALAAGTIAVAATAGRLLASVLAAAVIDRVSKRHLLLLADGGRLALTLGVSAAWLSGRVPPLSVVYGLACLVAAGAGFFDAARTAAIAEILPPDHLVIGNALEALLASLALTVTWGLSGVLVATLGPAVSLFLDAGTFLVSFSCVALARWSGPPRRAYADAPAKTTQGAWVDISEGAHWVRQSPLVRTMLLGQSAYVVAAAFFFTGLVPFLQQHLHGGAALYGVQGAVFGAGLAGASWLIGLRHPGKIGRLYSVGLVVNGIGNSLFALSPSVWYLLPAVLLAGIGKAAHATGERTLLQVHTPEVVRGRVFVLWSTVAQVVWTPALVLGGWVADHTSAQFVLLGASCVHVGLGLWLRAQAVVAHADMDAT